MSTWEIVTRGGWLMGWWLLIPPLFMLGVGTAIAAMFPARRRR